MAIIDDIDSVANNPPLQHTLPEKAVLIASSHPYEIYDVKESIVPFQVWKDREICVASFSNDDRAKSYMRKMK